MALYPVLVPLGLATHHVQVMVQSLPLKCVKLWLRES